MATTTAYVPQSGKTVTIYTCGTCSGIYSQQETHEKYSNVHLAAIGQTK